MDDTQRIVKCGNLSMQSNSGFFRKWQRKYLVLYDGSKSGIQRLELFDSEIKYKKQIPAKIISLVDCIRVVTCQRHKTYTFEVRTNEHLHLFAAQSYQDMNDWVNCLRLVAFGHQRPPVPSSAATTTSTTGASAYSNLHTQRQVQSRLGAAQLIESRTSDGSKALAINSTIHKISSSEYASDKRNHTNEDASSKSTSDNRLPAISSEMALAIGGGHLGAKQLSRIPLLGVPYIESSACLSSSNIQDPPMVRPRQRQPSLMGPSSQKPQPPEDSPFLNQPLFSNNGNNNNNSNINNNNNNQRLNAYKFLEFETMTPTVRGQLLSVAKSNSNSNNGNNKSVAVVTTLDEEEENMLYCSIEDNPSEHNYRVKIIETELSVRCQLKCYKLTSSNSLCQQYHLNSTSTSNHNDNRTTGFIDDPASAIEKLNGALTQPGVTTTNTTSTNSAGKVPLNKREENGNQESLFFGPVTFYQLIVGPQELTLLNDYSLQAAGSHQQTATTSSGLWSWPYQCIRRYGFDKDNCFMFEAGRKCTSGPGQFIVQTPKAHSIYQDVVNFVNAIRCSSSLSNQKNQTTKLATATSDQQFTSTTTTTTTAICNQSLTNLEQIVYTKPTNNDTLPKRENDDPNSLNATRIPVIWSPAGLTALRLDNSHQPVDESVVATNDSNRTQATFFKALERKHSMLAAQQSNSQSTLGDTNLGSNKPGARVKHSANDGQQAPINAAKCSLHKNGPSNGASSNSSSANSDDLTDESGYDQGEDSVDDSITSHCRGSKGDATRRKLFSANSPSSHPNHHPIGSTMSLMSNATLLVAPNEPYKQPDNHLNRVKPSDKYMNQGGHNDHQQKHQQVQQQPEQYPRLFSGTGKNLSRVIDHIKSINSSNDDHSSLSSTDDFETNLIKEVYSEITKLHATFAYTTDTTNAAAHNNSNNNGNNSNNNNNNNNNSHQQQHAPNELSSCENSSNISETNSDMCANDSGLGGTNLSSRHRMGNSNNVDDDHTYASMDLSSSNSSTPETGSHKPSSTLSTDDYETAHQNEHTIPTKASLKAMNYLNVNPVKGDLTKYQTCMANVSKSIHPKLIHINNSTNLNKYQQQPEKQTNSKACLNISPQSELESTTSKSINDLIAGSGEVLSHIRHTGPSKSYPDQLNFSYHQQESGNTNNKLPGHYLINDVQYAKISKNPFGVKYESCL